MFITSKVIIKGQSHTILNYSVQHLYLVPIMTMIGLLYIYNINIFRTLQSILNKFMFKNNYLELYKSSSSQHINPNILITHFHHIYSTLGCVLQDLQYQIGRLVLENSQFSQIIQRQQKNRQMDLNKNQRTSKNREANKQIKERQSNKQIVDVDRRRSNRIQDKDQVSRKSNKSVIQIKNKFVREIEKPKPIVEEAPSFNSNNESLDFLNILMKEDKNKQKNTAFLQQQMMKKYGQKNESNIDKKYQKFQNEVKQQQQIKNKPNKFEISGRKGEGESSYGDLMDKIFRDAQDKKFK